MQPMTPDDVRTTINALELDITIIQFEDSTATSQLAADNVGCELGQIVKSLGFMINKEKPILVLTSGDQTVDDSQDCSNVWSRTQKSADDDSRAMS